MNMKNLLTSSFQFRYQLLSRLICDCKYYLGYGNRSRKYLWGKNESDHIRYMFEIYDSFPDRDKPEWTSRPEIIDFGRQMGVNVMPIAKEMYKMRTHRAA